MRRLLTSRGLKAAVFVLCLSPIFLLGWGAWKDQLGANPIERITHATGDWTMRFLLLSLAITPVRKLTRWSDLIRFRRMLGLYAFFYGALHLTTYLWLDKFFEWPEIWKDVEKRLFITAGFLAFVLMIPLALTSTAGWIRRLGGARWRLLHRLVYFAGAAGVIHYYWLVKSDIRGPLLYGAILATLLLYRAAVALRGWLPERPFSAAGTRPTPS
jgi:sulfoxide reductase heme-binding subunit YedZ